MDMKVWMNVQLIGNRIYTAQLRSLSVFTYEFLFASRSCMPQRLDILQEYFSLVKDLNHTNKFKNEQTQLIFEIEGETARQLFAKLDKGKKYLICSHVRNSIW